MSSESGNLRGNNSNQETIEEEVVFTSEDEYYWYDSCGQDLIGTSLPSPPFPASPADASSWSVGVNRLTSDTDPNLLDSLRRVSSPVFDFNQQSPPSIEHNTNSSTEDSSATLSGSHLPLLSKPSTSHSSDSSNNTVVEKDFTMEDDEFFASLTSLEDHTVEIDSLIARFNKDTVDLLDLNSYKDELQKIFNRFSEFEKAYIAAKGKLDRRKPSDVPKLEQIKQLHEKFQKRVVSNEVEVKKKLRELQNADTLSRSDTSESLSRDKANMKIKHAVKKFKDLSKVVNDLGEVSEMSEHVVRECLMDSKEWKKDLKSYRDLKETIDLELLSVDIAESVVTDFGNTYDEMVTAVSNKIAELNKADKDLGLYALSETKAKSTIQYPDPFSGALGENVFKFSKMQFSLIR